METLPLEDCTAPPGFHAAAAPVRKPPSHLVAKPLVTKPHAPRRVRLFKADPPVEDLCDYPVLDTPLGDLGLIPPGTFTTIPPAELEEPPEAPEPAEPPETFEEHARPPGGPYTPPAAYYAPVLRLVPPGFTPPAPEPSAWALLAAGLAAIAFINRNRRKKRKCLVTSSAA